VWLVEGAVVNISRKWAMPSRHTFTIKPIKELIEKYVNHDELWIDPFGGFNSPCDESNDLNPEAPTKYHMDAVEFVRQYKKVAGAIVDPPYSPRQISECYKSIGRPVTSKDTQNAALYAAIKNELATRVSIGGLVICCGWNSQGMGINRGFEMVEILLVPHGAAHNDTIVTVERAIG
jgi:hypothetical protein